MRGLAYEASIMKGLPYEASSQLPENIFEKSCVLLSVANSSGSICDFWCFPIVFRLSARGGVRIRNEVIHSQT